MLLLLFTLLRVLVFRSFKEKKWARRIGSALRSKNMCKLYENKRRRINWDPKMILQVKFQQTTYRCTVHKLQRLFRAEWLFVSNSIVLGRKRSESSRLLSCLPEEKRKRRHVWTGYCSSLLARRYNSSVPQFDIRVPSKGCPDRDVPCFLSVSLNLVTKGLPYNRPRSLLSTPIFHCNLCRHYLTFALDQTP